MTFDIPASELPVVEVVAAVIFDETMESVLLALRKPSQHQGDRWEFPGGKIEADESHEQALTRELKEELDIEPVESIGRCTIEHPYAEKTVRLHVRDVFRYRGTPAGLEQQTLRWVPIPELAGLPFPAANQVIVEELVEGFQG